MTTYKLSYPTLSILPRSTFLTTIAFVAFWTLTICFASASERIDFPQAPLAQIGLSASKLSDVTKLLEQEVEAGKIAGAVAAIVRHGHIGYLKAVGYQDMAAGTPMQEDTIFRIASMTKAITSAGIMNLLEDGKLSLSDPVSKYLPEFAVAHVLADVEGSDLSTVFAEREITIQDLLTHRSGLTYGWFGPEKLDAIYRKRGIAGFFSPISGSREYRVGQIATVPLKFQPGTTWDYGVSIDVLGRVIEVISGLTLDQFLRERFFRPLKMRDTHFSVPEEKADRLASLYTVNEQQVLQEVTSSPVTASFLTFSADYCSAENRFFSGGGGLAASVTDYLRFLQMLLNGGELDGVRVLSANSVAMMTRNQIGAMRLPMPGHGSGFGFGFGVYSDKDACAEVVSEGTYSWGGIFNTFFWVDPQEQMIGVLMTQVFPFEHLDTRARFQQLAYDAIDDSGFHKTYWYQPGPENANPFFSGRQLRVNSAEATLHPDFGSRSETQSSGMARILIEEDLRKIRRADLVTEIWGGHPGTTNKRFSINGRELQKLPEVGTADQRCTHQYPSFSLQPNRLVNGYNSLQFGCDQGEAMWGHFIVDNVGIKIGLANDDERLIAAGLADFTARVEASPLESGEGFLLKLATPPRFVSNISAVHFQGRYYGYDENGNGWSSDWHGMTRKKSPDAILETVREAPFELTWDTSMLPAQKRVEVRALIEFSDAPGLQYSTAPLQELAIQERADEQVTLYNPTTQPKPFWSRDDQQKSCTIPIDIEPEDIVAAELYIVTWRGGAGNVKDYFTLNGHPFPVAEGDDHQVQYSQLAVDPSILQHGENEITLLSDTKHHGIEVLSPGPTLVIRHRRPKSSQQVNIETRDRASALSAKPDKYEQFSLMHSGDVRAGHRLFIDDQRTKCAICHRVDGEGGSVGPDLSKIGGKFDRPHLIESLLTPSQQIVEGYRTTSVVTQDGKSHAGIVTSREGDSISMVDSANRVHQIRKSEIEEQMESSLSLMPGGLADQLSLSEFSDLIAYLESLRTKGATRGAQIMGAITLPPGFRISTVATGLSGATAFEVTPDGRIFVCEQRGTLRVIKHGKLLDQPLLTVPVEMNWERGLIGVAVPPTFPIDPYVYVVYVTDKPITHHRVSRFRVKGDVVVDSSEEILLEGDDQDAFGGSVPAGHQGGAIHFGPDGMLYIGIGEQTAGDPAQRYDALQGKILRINPDGSIPTDNPFVNQTTGKYQSVWALGCRNPYTFAFQNETGLLFINDVGGKYEEINRGVAGSNYGWPIVEHGPCDRAEFSQAIHMYPEACISGGDFASQHLAWPEKYRGQYFFADFVHGWIKFLDPQSPEVANEFAYGLTRPVDIRFSHDDRLYVLLRNAWVADDKFQDGTGSLLEILYPEN